MLTVSKNLGEAVGVTLKTLVIRSDDWKEKSASVARSEAEKSQKHALFYLELEIISTPKP